MFLYGIKLKRWNKQASKDIDIILPSDIKLKLDENQYIVTKNDPTQGSGSGNDFDYVYTVSGQNKTVNVDVRIEKTGLLTRNTIEYDGFAYSVTPVFDILEAKMRYAQKPNTPSGQKHLYDLLEIMNVDWSPFYHYSTVKLTK